MRCRTARRLMTQEAEEPLPAKTRAQLSRHLGECAGCQRLFADVEEIDRLLSQAAWLEPPPELTDRVLARLPERSRAVVPRTPLGTRATLLAAAAAALLLVAFTIVALTTGLGPGQTEWALLWQGGRNLVVGGWESVAGLFDACSHVVSALWQSLGHRWWPVLGLVIALAALLWGWIWRRTRAVSDPDEPDVEE